MKLKEKISLEKVFEKEYKDKLVEPKNNKEAVITHFLHNSKNGVSYFHKQDAVWTFPSVGLSVPIFLFIPLKKYFHCNP